MQSSGGVIDVEGAAARPAACVLSGPAGGVVGAAFVAEAGGLRRRADVRHGRDEHRRRRGRRRPCPADHRTRSSAASRSASRWWTSTPSAPAAARSRGSTTAGRCVSGPRSAGAVPGPAAYGRGGEEPTVTDANLVLGYLADGAVLGRRGDACGGTSPSGRSPGSAWIRSRRRSAIVRVADAEMTRALRVISVERGLDPRTFALVAFGGAGPLHACSLAEELGIRTVLVPAASGVLSALGLAVSELRRDYRAAGRARASRSWRTVRPRELPGCRCERFVDARYRGQSLRADGSRRRLRAALRRGARAAVRVPDGGRGRAGLRPARRDPAGAALRAARGLGRARGPQAPGLRRRRRGSSVDVHGPGVPGRRAGDRRAAGGDLPRPARVGRRAGRHGDARPGAALMLDPVTLSVMTSALAGVAEEMGVVLVRSAYSSNIKERRDCSAGAVRRARPDGRPGRAHPCASGRDARVGRGRDRAGAATGRHVHPQRPVLRRLAPARRDDGLAAFGRRRDRRVRLLPRPPLGRRRDASPARCRPARPRSGRRA